jgi:glycosyltransferase involved in cell wall biosynthesis
VKKSPRCSLLISTYNRPGALRLCLLSILKQTVLPDEVIIGDDGSSPDTGQLISGMKDRFPIPLIHVWQPDEGFRLARIRNKSIAKARYEYLIQADGDLIFHPRFIADQLRFSRRGSFISGSRTLISPENTAALEKDPDLLSSGCWKKDLGKKYNASRLLPLAYPVFYFPRKPHDSRYVLGANMAFWKEDLLKINGYNEAFEGWGKEDNDISYRLWNTGIKLHFLKFAAIVYHLHHSEAPRGNFSVNDTLFSRSIEKKTTYIENGISLHL